MINRDTALYGILALVLSGPTYASLNCVSQPTCEAMGYVKNETCPDGSLVTCPFDNEYTKCVKKIANAELCAQFPLTSCPEGSSCLTCQTAEQDYFIATCNYADTCADKVEDAPTNGHLIYEDCTACNKTQQIATAWECDLNYVEFEGACVPCTIGSVYHADGNCTEYGTDNFYYKVEKQGIPPIGVVFQVNYPPLGTAGRVVALRDLKLSNSYLTGIDAWYQGNSSPELNPYSAALPMICGAPKQVVMTSTPNGKYATEALAAQITTFPNTFAASRALPVAAAAAKYLVVPEVYAGIWNYPDFLPSILPNGTTGWYLPTVTELQMMLADRFTIFQIHSVVQNNTHFAGLVPTTLNNLQNDKRLHAKYATSENEMYDGVIAEPIEGIYMSSSGANASFAALNLPSYQSTSVRYGADHNENVKARAVINFDKCPVGSIYPYSSKYQSTNPQHYDLSTNYGLRCM